MNNIYRIILLSETYWIPDIFSGIYADENQYYRSRKNSGMTNILIKFMIIISAFIISQIAMFIAMVFDFLSLQYKKREYTFLCLIFSASLISAHYFLLNKTVAGIIVFISVLRFATCYFTTNKKYLVIFLLLNTIVLFTTYKEIYDIIIYTGLFIFIIGNFQEDNRRMRKIMMVGTFILVLYNAIIFSPMGVIAEGSFLISNFIGYYRYYLMKQKK